MSIQEKQNQINSWLRKHNFCTDQIFESEELLDAILQLIVPLDQNQDQDHEQKEPIIHSELIETNGDYLRFVGLYYNVQKQYDKMIKYCQKGVDCFQHPYCMYALGYYYGEVVEPKDTSKMLEYMLQADSLQLIEASFFLGKYDLDERKDTTQAIHYFKKGLPSKHKKCIWGLVNIYSSEEYFSTSLLRHHLLLLISVLDETIELEYKTKKELLFTLGNWFLNRSLNPKESLQQKKEYEEKALDLFHQAVKLNHYQSLFFIALIYENQKNIPQMLYYLEQSANHGNGQAMLNLGDYYYDKAIEKKNEDKEKEENEEEKEEEKEEKEKLFEKAHEWFEKAGQHNVPEAYTNLGSYYQTIKPDETKMLYYYEKAIKENEYVAMINLIIYYGYGTKQNFSKISKMMHYYSLILQLKNKDALELLEQIFPFVQKEINLIDRQTLITDKEILESRGFSLLKPYKRRIVTIE